jgi:putative hydrolase of HD superfamily
MCLVHDLPEARIGDLNYVQRFYLQANEPAAIGELTADLPFGEDIKALLDEFNRGESLEARLAHDADQLAFLVELKSLSDLGYATPPIWVPQVCKRLWTDIRRSLAESILETPADEWWRQKFIDKKEQSQ